MKYELETIPVWDAYRARTECPLCLLQRKAEQGYVSFFLGSSVMAPEMRVQVNETGFCPPHFTMLMGGENRLGLALVTHTHIGELRKALGRQPRASKRGGALRKQLAALRRLITERLERCMICDRLDERFKRYAYTIAYLWQHEPEFRTAFTDSRGFCMSHLPGMLDMAAATLRAAPLQQFVAELDAVEQRSWDRIEHELLAFTGKFDYQAERRDAAATREAVANAIQKLTGGDVPRGGGGAGAAGSDA